MYTLPERKAYLTDLITRAKSCNKCEALCESRKQVVVGRTLISGETNLDADIFIIGEAPGFHEDIAGIPFVGASGEMLQSAIDTLDLTTKVYITNTIKCRPANNRDPLLEEKENCFLYLRGQIRIFRPKLIVTLGKHAANTLLDTDLSMSNLLINEDLIYYDQNRDIKIPVFPMYHPSYILHQKSHNPRDYDRIKKAYWQRFQSMKDFYNILKQG